MATLSRPEARRAGTLHVVDRLSEPVLSVLAPALQALADAGWAQTVVLLDRPAHAEGVRRLDGAASVVCVPTAGREPWRHWAALRRAVQEQLAARPPAAVHFHGVGAWLCSLGLEGRPAKAFVTPHGAGLARVVGLLQRLPRAGADLPLAVASSQFDTRVMQHASQPPPLVVEGVVEERYLRVARREAELPLVVAGAHRASTAAAGWACQLAIVFGARELGLRFHWCGPGAPELAVAGFTLGTGDPVRHLRRAWVYVATDDQADFPVRLAQAMACGVPCLALDVPAHRGLIVDGSSGMLFRTAEEAAQMLTALLDDADLRQRLGDAARRVARRRFTVQRLRRDLLSLYARDATEPALRTRGTVHDSGF